MGMKDNFSHPRGWLGRMMLSGMNMGHSPMAKWAFTQFEVPRKGDIVDIGCGGGANLKRLLAACPEGRVFGVDISEESVKKSIAVNRKEIGRRCKVMQGSVEQLPFESGSLDMATAFETVYFWPDLGECFKEVRRVLRPGGRFVVTNDPGDPNKHWEDTIPGMKVYTAEQIVSYMKKAGFSRTRVSRHKNMFCVIGQVGS